jgi:radical SAM superfamily enzyme YgiQ (UPF0313 family)
MPMPRVIMIFPMQGFSGTYVRHAPLSLLYASAGLVKHGYDIKILDTRLHMGDWQERLRQMIVEAPTLAVGISVMSGRPIRNAIDIGRFVKSVNPDVKVVWGGPHATFYPETILSDESSADYVVSGYAAQSFSEMCEKVRQNEYPAGIPGITWREGDVIKSTAADTSFEFLPYEDIPYHLIEDYSVYGQLDQEKRIFSMYSAVGCPYQCSFCSSPAQYRTIQGRKWVPLSPADVANHVQHVVERYGANYIYFIDDDSFPKLQHVSDVIDQIKARNLKVGLGFRGARINEIKRMSHEFLDKLADAGTDIMHIGAECGSDRLLKLIRKDCTVADIIEANRKLAKHPQITAAYNFIIGLPSETYEDVQKTRELMLRLVDDNPNCLVFPPNKFRPLPGTELYAVAEKEWGYKMPHTLDAWANIEVEADINGQWYDARMMRLCNLMLIGSYFIDRKIIRMTKGKSPFIRCARLADYIYGPLARLRMRHGFDRCLLEYNAYRFMIHQLGKSGPA